MYTAVVDRYRTKDVGMHGRYEDYPFVVHLPTPCARWEGLEFPLDQLRDLATEPNK